jgi:hypothetical protein
MVTVQEKAMRVFWFFERKSVIKMQRRYKNQHRKDVSSENAIRHWLKQFSESDSVVAANEKLDSKCWRTLGGKLNTAWISYVPRKALKLFRNMQNLFYIISNKTNLVILSYSSNSFILFALLLEL